MCMCMCTCACSMHVRVSLHYTLVSPARRRKQGRHARFGSSGALAEQPAVARTAVELHGCCARTSLAAALLSQHVDCVTRAGSAGTESGSRARSLVLPWSNLGPAHHVGRPSREAHGLEDQLQLDDEHEAISKIADGGATSGCLPGGPPPSARFCLGFEDRVVSALSSLVTGPPQTLPFRVSRLPCPPP